MTHHFYSCVFPTTHHTVLSNSRGAEKWASEGRKAKRKWQQATLSLSFKDNPSPSCLNFSGLPPKDKRGGSAVSILYLLIHPSLLSTHLWPLRVWSDGEGGQVRRAGKSSLDRKDLWWSIFKDPGAGGGLKLASLLWVSSWLVWHPTGSRCWHPHDSDSASCSHWPPTPRPTPRRISPWDFHDNPLRHLQWIQARSLSHQCLYGPQKTPLSLLLS